MILVVGANGTVGSRLVRRLVEGGHPVRALVRDVPRAVQHGPAVAIAEGDLAWPGTLGPALAGVDRVFLVTNGPAAVEKAAIDAARAAGVAHVVKLSSMGFGPSRDALAIGNWHREVEDHLAASRLPWTVLRAGGFSTNALGWGRSIRERDAVFAPAGDGKVAVVDPDDLAGAAAAVLAAPVDRHAGARYELTGPEALGFAEQVAILAEALGRPLRFVDVPPGAARDEMLRTGMPAALVEPMLEVMAAIRAGGAATVTPTAAQLLGRPARTFAHWVAANLAAFQ